MYKMHSSVCRFGDRLLMVNGQDFHNISRKKAADVLRSCDQLSVTMEISRIIPKLKPHAMVSDKVTTAYPCTFTCMCTCRCTCTCMLYWNIGCLCYSMVNQLYTVTLASFWSTWLYTCIVWGSEICTNVVFVHNRRCTFVVKRHSVSGTRRDCMCLKWKREVQLSTTCCPAMRLCKLVTTSQHNDSTALFLQNCCS